MSEPKTLPCIRCGHKLDPVFEDNDTWPSTKDNQPFNGTTFVSYGHYGSTVFDPMSAHRFLELNVCDPCLRELAELGHVLLGHKPYNPPVPVNYTTWDPGKDDWG